MSGRLKLPKNSILPTELILVAGATVGALLGAFFMLMTSTMAVAATGPFGFVIFAPFVFALYAVGNSWALVGPPLWALLGGRIFAGLASGRRGSAAKNMQVTFFSEEHPITKTTRQMTDFMGIPPVPYVGWFPNEEINAFAMGTIKHNTVVALSKGAIEKLTKSQLEAVIAHELGHVASNDMARMTYARGIRNALTFFLVFRGLKRLARWVFTPLSELELLRFSRAREFTADAIAAQVTSPEAIIGVLKKLAEQRGRPRVKGYDHAMMWNGLVKRSWLSTHPPLEDRIAALEAIKREKAMDRSVGAQIAAE